MHEGGRIVGLEGPPPEGARVVDARGRVVTPGLIDAHLHAYIVSVDLLENEALPMSYVASKAARRLEGALRRGFTTVRDVAGGDIGLRMAIDDGLIDGPRYLFTGPGLTQTGGHGDARPGHLAIEVLGHHAGEIVDGVDACDGRCGSGSGPVPTPSRSSRPGVWPHPRIRSVAGSTPPKRCGPSATRHPGGTPT